MSAYKPTKAQLRLLANLRDGRPAGDGIASGKAAEVESNCTRNGLLRAWPFPGRGRLSEAGWRVLEGAR
jgi:hypothetical protein